MVVLRARQNILIVAPEWKALMMRLDEFEDLLDRHGEDVTAWPAPDRDAGLALLHGSPAARALIEEAQALRRALNDDDPPAAPAHWADRAIASAVQPQMVSPPTVSLRAALVFGVCFASGFALSLVPDLNRERGVQVDVTAVLAGMLQ